MPLSEHLVDVNHNSRLRLMLEMAFVGDLNVLLA